MQIKEGSLWIKQAPRAWYGKIIEFLTQNGYTVAPTNPSLLVKAQDRKLVVILEYVDDLIIIGDCRDVITTERGRVIQSEADS